MEEGGKKRREKKKEKGTSAAGWEHSTVQEFLSALPILSLAGCGSGDWILGIWISALGSGLRDSGEASQELPQCESVTLKGA